MICAVGFYETIPASNVSAHAIKLFVMVLGAESRSQNDVAFQTITQFEKEILGVDVHACMNKQHTSWPNTDESRAAGRSLVSSPRPCHLQLRETSVHVRVSCSAWSVEAGEKASLTRLCIHAR